MDVVKYFDGLLDSEAAEILVHGTRLPKIKEAEGSVGLYGKVLSVGKIKHVGKNIVRNVLIGDETGCCIVALWGENARKEIKEGDVIKIINGFAKQGYYGKEINVGERSEVRIAEKNIAAQHCDNFFSIEGKLMKKLPTSVYINEGKERFIKRIFVDKKCIFLVNDRIKDINEIETGSYIKIKWAYMKNGRIFVDDIGRITEIK